MKHDGIEQHIEVAEISVTAYERMGWQVVDPPAEDETAAAKGRRRTSASEGEN
jgi:hypothetical protein